MALLENYPAGYVAKTLKSLLMRTLNFPFVSSIFPPAATRPSLDFPQETRDYIKAFGFIAANLFVIMKKRGKIERLRTRPRDYLLGIWC